MSAATAGRKRYKPVIRSSSDTENAPPVPKLPSKKAGNSSPITISSDEDSASVKSPSWSEDDTRQAREDPEFKIGDTASESSGESATKELSSSETEASFTDEEKPAGKAVKTPSSRPSVKPQPPPQQASTATKAPSATTLKGILDDWVIKIPKHASTNPFSSASAMQAAKRAADGCSAGVSLVKTPAPTPIATLATGGSSSASSSLHKSPLSAARLAFQTTLATSIPVASTSRTTLDVPTPSTSKAPSASRTTLDGPLSKPKSNVGGSASTSTKRAPKPSIGEKLPTASSKSKPAKKTSTSAKPTSHATSSSTKLDDDEPTAQPPIDATASSSKLDDKEPSASATELLTLVGVEASPSLSTLKAMGFDDQTASRIYEEVKTRRSDDQQLRNVRDYQTSNWYRSASQSARNNRRIAPRNGDIKEDYVELTRCQMSTLLGSSALPTRLNEVPLLSLPFDTCLLLWVAPDFLNDCISPNARARRQYLEMLGFLQLVVISTTRGMSTDDWMAIIDPYLTKGAFANIWPAASSVTGSNKAAGTTETNKKLLKQALDKLKPAVVLKAFKQRYPQHQVHATVWAVVEAADAAIEQTTSIDYQKPVLLPGLLWAQTDVTHNVAAAEHLHDTMDDVLSGILVGGRTAIIASYSTSTITHVVFELLDVDPRRPAWQDLRQISRNRRIEALIRAAQGHPRTFAALFPAEASSSAADDANEASFGADANDVTRRKTNRMAASHNKLLCIDRRAVLSSKCWQAAYYEGYKAGTPALTARAEDLFVQNTDLLHGEHRCEGCCSPFEWAQLTLAGRKQRKALGMQGGLHPPFNLAFYRIDPKGTFDRWNLKRYCVGCTRIAVKIGHEQLRPLLARIATEASSETDADGFLCAPLPDPPTTLDGDDTDALMVFAARKFTTCKTANPQRHTAGGTARVPDFYKAAALCYLGGKRFRDPSGLDLPLSVGEIDRLKPESKYDAARPNERVFRVMFSGFNDIRSDAVDDTPVVVYINGVKANAHLWLDEKELRLAQEMSQQELRLVDAGDAPLIIEDDDD